MLKIVSIVFVLLFLSEGIVKAAPEKDEEKKQAIIIVDDSKNTKNDRPRAPQRSSSVECYYQDGIITIEFETTEGDATFTVTDVVTGDNASTMFNTAMEFNYFIGSEPSTYLLEISTSEGNNYEGFLTID